MVLSERQAADLRANQAVGKAVQTLSRHVQGGRGKNEVLAFRSGLREAVPELAARLVEIYAELTDAGEMPLRDELITEVTRRVSSFVQSSVAGVRGQGAGLAAREGEREIGTQSASIRSRFDLAVTDHHKARKTAPLVPAPEARRKQDKFEILDSPRQFDSDFKTSIGLLGVAVIFFDLDNFKRLNTRFTEPVVDRTLLSELQRLIAALVVGRGFAYAEGGDEFVITLPNTNTALAEPFTLLLLERIRTATFMVEGEPISVTASAGLASSMNAEDSQACRDAAAAAKQEAKDRGKDRHVVSARLR